ncbi:histidine kinase [Gephyromycinifex aptenodytis]|uniref:histidine kinase n=1 Tax=Gephyromycinifex aptenodytis TaxID=2716227 RepID=UPI0014481B94|nr:histidine kinase [Gephyromycinifex aptenodytis]
MSDLSSLANIAERLRTLKEQVDAEHDSEASTAVRFVVATDWSSAAGPLAVLRAYQAAFGSAAPVELCFAVPNEPGEQDEACVQVLLEGLRESGGVGRVRVESFEEASAQAYDAAVVPGADPELLLSEVAGVITRMFDVSRRMGAEGQAPADAGQGDPAALATRLQNFVA